MTARPPSSTLFPYTTLFQSRKLHRTEPTHRPRTYLVQQQAGIGWTRSEEHTSELQSHPYISYAVFCLKRAEPRWQPPLSRHVASGRDRRAGERRVGHQHRLAASRSAVVPSHINGVPVVFFCLAPAPPPTSPFPPPDPSPDA